MGPGLGGLARYGLGPLRVRGLARVQLHADLTMLARLSQALAQREPCLSRRRPSSSLTIEARTRPYGASVQCVGSSGFLPSPNHWRILAIKLLMRAIIRPLWRFANRFAHPS